MAHLNILDRYLHLISIEIVIFIITTVAFSFALFLDLSVYENRSSKRNCLKILLT